MADYAISNVDRRIVYTGSAGVGPYAFNFEVLAQTDIAVYKNSTLLTLTTNYTVSINPTTGVGSVTLTSAATSADTITIVGARAIERTTDFTTGGDLFANTLNDELDSQTILTQQVAETAERAIKAPVTDPTSIDMTLASATDRANTFMYFDANGEPAYAPVGDFGAPSAVTRQRFSGDDSTTVFTLARDPGASGSSVVIYMSGVYQQSDTYTIVGDTLTFSEAPVTGTNNIEVVHFAVTDIGETDASAVSYIPAGTGAVATNVQAKLRESVSVKDFGAVGDGVTNDTAAIQAAHATGKYVVYVRGETYRITAGVNEAAIKMIAHGATIYIDRSGGNFDFCVHTAPTSLYIEGGTFTRTGAQNGGILVPSAAATMTELTVKDAKFVGDSVVSRWFFVTTGSTIDKVRFLRNEFSGYLRGAIELRAEIPDAIVDDNYLHDAGNTTGLGNISIGLGYGTTDGCTDSKIRGNRIEDINVTNCSGAEVQGIIVYGRSAAIIGNSLARIYSDYTDDCEGIYSRAAYSRIVGNYLLDAACSHDGAITVKGSQTEVDVDFADHQTVSANVIEFTNAAYVAPAITNYQNSISITGNILKNIIGTRDSLDVGPSGSPGHAFGSAGIYSYTGNRLNITGNVIDGFRFGIVADSITRQINISNNTLEKCYGGDSIYIRGADTTVTGVVVSNNVIDGVSITTDSGIRIQGAGSNVIANAVVSGNYINHATAGIKVDTKVTVLEDINNQFGPSVTTQFDLGATVVSNVRHVRTDVAFLAYVGSQLDNVTGDGTIYTVILNTETYDRGNNYNIATGVFTAPMAGIYEFSIEYLLRGLGAANTSCDLALVTSNDNFRVFGGNIGAIRDSSNDLQIGATFQCFMDVNDTASVRARVNGGTKVVDVGTTTKFAGRLVA